MFTARIQYLEGVTVVIKNDMPIFIAEFIFGNWNFYAGEEECMNKLEEFGMFPFYAKYGELIHEDEYRDIQIYFLDA